MKEIMGASLVCAQRGRTYAMKILFVITSSMDTPSPSWHLMKALLEDTLAAGIRVHAVQRHYPDVNISPFPEEILSCENFSYTQIESQRVDRRALAKRYLGGIPYALKLRKVIKAHDDYDMIFVQSAPASLFYLLAARNCAKKRPVIYNSQDMFPGSAIANGTMKKKWMQKIFYAMQKYAYKKADIITAISEDMKVKLMEQGVPEEKIRVIVNWYDDTAVKEIPWEENKFVVQENMSKDKFYVQYAGTMGTNFNPDIILDVAEKLKAYPDIVFQMIGDGVRRKKFEQNAKDRGLDNIVFLPLQSQDMVPHVYSACSVCLIPLKQGVIGNSVPSKAALLMACGRVIVNSVDEDSDYYDMFHREKIGFSAGTRDVDKLAKDILYLYENPEERKQYGQRAKAYGQKDYTRKVNTKRYIDLFEELTKS